MRYCRSRLFAFAVLSGGLCVPALLPTVVAAQVDPLPANGAQSPNFWGQAQEITQAQLFLVDRLETAIASPDPNRVRAARGQLTLQASTVDRFLRRYYPLPQLLCAPVPNPSVEALPPEARPEQRLFVAGSNLEPDQAQVYCSLYRSTQALAPLAPVLDRRLHMLATVAEVRPLPLIGREALSYPIPGIMPQQPILGTPALPLSAPAPVLPPVELGPPGRPVKPAIANYTPPLSPAILPPPEAALPLQRARQTLAQAQAAFPGSTPFIDSRAVAQDNDRFAYGLRPQEVQQHSAFLAQPNTGIARILPATAYQTSPTVVQNRLAPTVAERFPFAPLLQRADDFVPRLALQVTADTWQLVAADLDYGFITDVGDIPLDQLDASLQQEALQLSPEHRQAFLGYRPPTRIEALQRDRRRFATGKVNALGLQASLTSQTPVHLNRTYLMRSLQFALPTAVFTGQSTTRRNLEQALATPSSDLLVALRPVSRQRDGSYVVLWRVLGQFPDPQIQDLDRYLRTSHGLR